MPTNDIQCNITDASPFDGHYGDPDVFVLMRISPYLLPVIGICTVVVIGTLIRLQMKMHSLFNLNSSLLWPTMTRSWTPTQVDSQIHFPLRNLDANRRISKDT